MSLQDELIFLAFEYFKGEDRAYLIDTAESGESEKMMAVIYETEQKLDGRVVNG